MNKAIAFVGQVGAAVAFWLVDYYYPDDMLEKGFLTFLSLAVIYLVFKILLEHAVVKQVRDGKMKYSIRKALSTVYIVVFIAIVIQIWAQSSEALLVSYGIMGAGIAIALQDLFKNFVGGLTILFAGVYRVGDRVEVDSRQGDVIDIGLMTTTLLEIGEWVGGDQATGRLTVVPNGAVLSKAVHNYTKDHSFIWDELSIPLTYDSDWRLARDRFMDIAKEQTAQVEMEAEKQMASIMEKYYFSKRAVEPAVFITPTDNWITLTVRYITDFRERRGLKSKLYSLLLEEIERSEGKIKIASESLIVSNPLDFAGRRRS